MRVWGPQTVERKRERNERSKWENVGEGKFENAARREEGERSCWWVEEASGVGGYRKKKSVTLYR